MYRRLNHSFLNTLLLAVVMAFLAFDMIATSRAASSSAEGYARRHKWFVSWANDMSQTALVNTKLAASIVPDMEMMLHNQRQICKELELVLCKFPKETTEK